MQRKHLPYDLERFTRVVVRVDLVGLGGEKYLAARGRGAQAIQLALGHCAGTLAAGAAELVCADLKILIFHGYLLLGTGSNVYNAELGAALVHAGHEVHLLCQERSPVRA